MSFDRPRNKISLHEMSCLISKMEGKKEEMTIAQIKEVMLCVAKLLGRWWVEEKWENLLTWDAYVKKFIRSEVRKGDKNRLKKNRV